jgi:hypothetical protein
MLGSAVTRRREGAGLPLIRPSRKSVHAARDERPQERDR